MAVLEAPKAVPGVVSAESRYNTLLTFRDPFLRRAWDCSEVTLPTLLPRNGHTGYKTITTPWQSVGARCVNNLAAKTLMASLPPNTPIFRLRVDDILLAKHAVSPEDRAKFDSGLGKMERAVMAQIEMDGDRVGVFEMIKHLIVAGNALLHEHKDGLRVYHLNSYVVRRDPSGNPLEIIASEQVDPVVLPEAVQEFVRARHAAYATKAPDLDKPLTVYTRIQRLTTHWTVYQEVCGMTIPGSQGRYPIDRSPWLAIRFTRVDGEDYGRSYVEEYLGDLRSLEDLSQALVEGARAMAKLLLMVNPNGSTQITAITDAANGDTIYGIREEVSVLQMEKSHDFSVAERQARVLEDRLAYAFLLNSSVQRDAERVTAEEVRYLAQELETTLGGFHTIFGEEFQHPYIRVKMARMQKENRLPQLPKGVVRVSVITGIAALGRGNDRAKLVAYIRSLTGTLGPDATAEILDTSEVALRLATADGIETEGLIKSADEVAASRQQNMMMQMAQKLGPQAISTGGKLAEAGMQPPAAQ